MSSSLTTAIENIENGRLSEAMDDIVSLLSNPDELYAVSESGDAAKKLLEERQRQQMQAQDIIRGLLSLKDDKASTLETDKSASQSSQEEERLQRVLSGVSQEVGEMQKESQSLQKENSELQAEEAELIEKRERIKEQTTHVLPKTRYNISLYTCITGIKWNYECQPEEIKGYVTTSKDVRPINLNSQKNSKYFITNYIWDLVESACATK